MSLTALDLKDYKILFIHQNLVNFFCIAVEQNYYIKCITKYFFLDHLFYTALIYNYTI